MTETQKKRRVGRPRKDTEGATSRRTLILEKATELINENGYSHTSMSDIARAVDLDQSSLYYWFKSKDLIFAEIVKERKPVSITKEIFQEVPEDWALRLYVAVYTDMMVLCDLPFDYYTVEEVVLDSEKALEPFMVKYRSLVESIKSTVESGIADGSFRVKSAEHAVIGILSLNEGLQHRFRVKRSHDIGPDDLDNAFQVAKISAFSAIRALCPERDPHAIHRQAVEGGWVAEE